MKIIKIEYSTNENKKANYFSSKKESPPCEHFSDK